MRCPRCLEEVTGDRCPKCGRILSESEKQPVEPASTQGAIRFEAASRTPRSDQIEVDWRKEVRKKFERHQSRKEGETTEPGSGTREAERKRKAARDEKRKDPPSQPAAAKPAPSEVSRKLFKYRLSENKPESERRIVTFRQSGADVAKPVIRKTSKPARKPEPNDPRQRPLELVQKTLKAPPPESPIDEFPELQLDGPAVLEPDSSEVTKEALFSRTLAGLLDLIIALLSGGAFGLVGSQLMAVDLTSPVVMEVAAACAAAFWFLNNVFFLFVARQTPGMMVTDLQLVPEERVKLGMARIVARVLLQVLSTVSVVGLLWAIFEDLGRCWHDRVSRTMVVPIDTASDD